MDANDELSLDLRARVADLLGYTPESWIPVRGGYTPAKRYLVSAGSKHVFVKTSKLAGTAATLLREISSYRSIRASFMPKLMACDDDSAEPVLIIEDLSKAIWPPPWTSAKVDAALEQIDAMHSLKFHLPTFRVPTESSESGWKCVRNDPAPFLSLGFASGEWLRSALPKLMEAEDACNVEGAATCHFDLRSDNMCFSENGVKFIDWADACIANPELDLGAWLPSLHFEGGPRPDDILPNAPEIASYVSGYFASHAGLPNIPEAPFVRRVQMEQLSTALPWAIRALKLDDI